MAVEQRVVGLQAQRGAGDARRLANQPDHLLELRRQSGEVGVPARVAPGHLALRRRARHGLDEGRLERMGVAVLAAHLAQVGTLPGLEIGLGLGPGELLAGLGMDQEVVGEALQRRELLATVGGRLPRHDDGRIPVQDRERTLDARDSPEPLLKRRVMPAHRALPGRSRPSGRQRHTEQGVTAKMSTPAAWWSTACQIGTSSRITSAPRPTWTMTRPAATCARWRTSAGRPGARRAWNRRASSISAVSAARTRWATWMRTASSARSGRSAPLQVGQVAQASEAPLFAVMAALIIARSAVTPGDGGERSRCPCRPLPPAAARASVRMRKMTVRTRSAVPRWMATDQGLLRSRTVRPPSAPWTRRSSRSATPQAASDGRARRWRGSARRGPGQGARGTRRQAADGPIRASPVRRCSRGPGMAAMSDGQRHPMAVAGRPVGAGQARVRGAHERTQDDQEVGQDRGSAGGDADRSQGARRSSSRVKLKTR